MNESINRGEKVEQIEPQLYLLSNYINLGSVALG